MRDYKKIRAYQYADDLCLWVYQASRQFPQGETYGLTSQIRRAAVSVAANIVEGAGRQTSKDYLHFLFMARGSLSELQYLISLSARLEYIQQAEHEKLAVQAEETAKILFGLINSVKAEV